MNRRRPKSEQKMELEEDLSREVDELSFLSKQLQKKIKDEGNNETNFRKSNEWSDGLFGYGD